MLSFFNQFGPAGMAIFGFIGLIGGVAGVYAANVMRCRLSGGRDCGRR